MPVTGFYSAFLFQLALSLANFQAVVNARCITDNKGRAGISFRFLQGLHKLILIGAHSDLSYIYITVCRFHKAEVFFLRLLARCCELCYSCRRRCLRSLTARIGIYFRIEYEDVNVFVHSQDMVKTAVTDIVSPTVSAEEPLTAFYKELLHLINTFQFNMAVFFSFQKCRNLFSPFARAFAYSHLFFPFKESVFQGRTCSCGFQSFFYIRSKEFAFRFFSNQHAETVFGIVFEKGCCPSRTVALFVLRITACRCTAAPYGRTTVCIGNHHAITV